MAAPELRHVNKVEQALDQKLPVVVIAGPTASGKTALAVQVAQELQSEIISADSRQIYRYMDIATAKPTAEEMGSVRHHALDLVDPDAAYNAGAFSRLAHEIMVALWQEGKIPILAGGSGLYIKAVLDGLFEDEFDYGKIRNELKEKLQEKGPAALHAQLQRLDPVAAKRLPQEDTQRLLRALEVAHARSVGGQATYAGLHQAWVSEVHSNMLPMCFAIGHTRADLYERIDKRATAMWKQGVLAEIERLESLGFDESSCGLKTMGYEEGWACFKGAITADKAIEQIQRRTRQFAKRQMTWFRGDRRMRWLDPNWGGAKGMAKRIIAQVEHLSAKSS